jgi:hypothetical protein
MTPRQIRAVRAAERFMPRLWDFAYPMEGRRYKQARRIALRAWAFAFRVRIQLLDV